MPSNEKNQDESIAAPPFDIDAAQAFDDLVGLAAQIFGLPMAFISFVDGKRHQVAATVELDKASFDRASSFCSHALLNSDAVFVVEDATLDERLADSRPTSGAPFIRFYAGATISGGDGVSAGVIYVIGVEARTPCPAHVHALRLLARQAAIVLASSELRDVQQTRQNERLELALSAAQIGLWDLDVPRRRAVYSDRWWSLLGYLPGEIEVVEGLWKSLVHPDDEQKARQGMDRLLDGRDSSYAGEVRMLHKDGTWLWLHDRANVVERGLAGAPLRVVGVSMNVTGRKATEVQLTEERHRLQLISDNMPALITRIDRDEKYTFANAHHDRVFGLRSSSMVGLTMREVCGPDTYRKIVPFVTRALSGEFVRFEDEGPAAGGITYYQSNFVPDVGTDGSVAGFYAMVFDISERRVAEQSSIEQQRRLRGIADNVPALIAELDADGCFTFCNRAYLDWLGVDPETMIGKRLVELFAEDFYGLRQEHMARAYEGNRVVFEQVVTLKLGERCLQTTYIPRTSPDGSVTGIYALSSDISELKDTQSQLAALAREDSLTGLPNRRVFEERLQSAIARAGRTGGAIAVLYVDVDHFKAINDFGGHAMGDIVLKELSLRFRRSVRKTDIVARYAGDEFVLLLEDLHEGSEATSVAEKILATMTVDVQTPTGGVPASVSIGVAVHHGDDASVASLLALADAALYRAKRSGRNRFSS